jgi:hypothetical protein
LSNSDLTGLENTRMPVIPTQFLQICGIIPGPQNIKGLEILVSLLLGGTLSLNAIWAFRLCAPNVKADSVAAVIHSAA